MKKFKFIALTVIFIIIFLVIEIVIIRNLSRYEPMVNVVYARTHIPENTVILPEMVEERKVHASMAHKQSLESSGEVVGKVSRVELLEGEMILSSRLLQENLEDNLVKDPDNRLFSIEFKGDQANGWWLKVDQHVDIIFIPDALKHPGKSAEPEAEIVRLRNIRVAAIIDEKGKRIKAGDGGAIPRYISFEVTDKQDEFLAYAKGNGRLELSVIPEADVNSR